HSCASAIHRKDTGSLCALTVASRRSNCEACLKGDRLMILTRSELDALHAAAAVGNVLPPMDDFDLDKLYASIIEHGVREAIVVDEFGKPIDGHYRKAIANTLVTTCPERTLTGMTEPEKYEYARTHNAARRHLTIEQRREIWDENRAEIKHLLLEQATRSDASIARQLGVDDHTVAKVREDLESSSDIRPTEHRFAYGGGERVEREPQAINNADHKGELYFKLDISYPSPSEEIRMRGTKPYPKESERLNWVSGQLYLVADAPRNFAEADALVDEIAERTKREMRKSSIPFKTMIGAFR